MSLNPFNTATEFETVFTEKMSATPDKKKIRKAYTAITIKTLSQGAVILVGATVLATAGVLVLAALDPNQELVEEI